MSVAIRLENISKQYRLGEVGTGTLSHDLHRAWAKLLGKPDPLAKVGAINDRTQSSTKNKEQRTRNGAASEYVWALRDINFEVQQGEILGIIGRNGAGKSTLLKILSRVTAPTTGRIKSRGRIASLLEVGTGFHPELTGLENIYLNGSILGMRRHEITRQLEEIVEFSGCAKYIDTPVKRYSSGMTVRLGFAVAAHLDCEILVVDEVLAVGDVEFQKKCLGKMQSIAGKGRTVLFVSHNLSAILQLCSRTVVLDRGTVFFDGSTQKGCDQYLMVGDAEQSKEFNLELISRSDSLNGMARLKACRLRTDDSSAAWGLPFGETICIEIDIESMRDFNWLELGIAISKPDGIEIVSSLSTDCYDFGPVSKGPHRFTISFEDLRLLPQGYAISFGLRSERGMEDHVINGPYLDILTNENSAKAKAETRSGFLLPNVEVVFGKINDDDCQC